MGSRTVARIRQLEAELEAAERKAATLAEALGKIAGLTEMDYSRSPTTPMRVLAEEIHLAAHAALSSPEQERKPCPRCGNGPCVGGPTTGEGPCPEQERKP